MLDCDVKIRILKFIIESNARDTVIIKTRVDLEQ